MAAKVVVVTALLVAVFLAVTEAAPHAKALAPNQRCTVNTNVLGFVRVRVCPVTASRCGSVEVTVWPWVNVDVRVCRRIGGGE